MATFFQFFNFCTTRKQKEYVLSYGAETGDFPMQPIAIQEAASLIVRHTET